MLGEIAGHGWLLAFVCVRHAAAHGNRQGQAGNNGEGKREACEAK